MTDVHTLAARILAADQMGGSDSQKLSTLVQSLSPQERQGMAGRWITEHGHALFWDDNLLAWAERVWELPTKPVDPQAPEMPHYQEVVTSIVGANGMGAPPASTAAKTGGLSTRIHGDSANG